MRRKLRTAEQSARPDSTIGLVSTSEDSGKQVLSRSRDIRSETVDPRYEPPGGPRAGPPAPLKALGERQQRGRGGMPAPGCLCAIPAQGAAARPTIGLLSLIDPL